MKFVLAIGGNWYSGWKAIQKAVPEADELGFWGFVMPDHYMWGPNMGGDSTLDTWIALTYLAARTKNIRLGTLVTPIPFRSPSILAKMVSSLDRISRGRVVLGVGAGWSQVEFEGYSEWNEPKIRVDKTQEGLELILKLWQEENPVSFSGNYYRAKNAVLDPKPSQRPYPPLLFGGSGSRMLRLAGQYADICFIPPWAKGSPTNLKEIVLKEARLYGRETKISFASLISLLSYPPSFAPKYDRQTYMDGVKTAKESGINYLIVPFSEENYLDSINDFAQNIISNFDDIK